jgi:tRNA(Ile)-lysidine synthase
MILLAVSGGPDSMALLNDYHKSTNVIVGHVNYKKRSDSDVDQKIVEDFCKKYDIKLEVLVVKTQEVGNFQK